ncbi:non-specific lipid-transfer protein 1-like [Euphorbia lathyris]|uniref:non-specific lipid-transfer protein 1-like n=1 Tax=Euphorbia lathyris TaxID=212925 RepID=UPI003313F9AE
MAAMKLAVLVVAIMVAAGTMWTAEGITCGQVSGALSPCINYLKSGGAPTPQCCAGLRNINGAAKTTADRQQACNCLKSAARTIPGLNPANAQSLPGKCNVNIPYKLSLSTNCNSIK